MPYACDARGGGVRLYPAPQQSYRIYGKREKWLFRYCSPNAPDRCHHWMLHQFDVDCGGIRVPWIRVAEASSPDGRAWVEQGRMTLKLGSAEASPREERMARRRWWWRDRGAYPADERERFDGPSGPHSEMVELPAGFAPVLGTRAQFIGAQPDEISSGPAERDSEMAAVAPAKPTAPAPPKREASPAAKPKEAAAPAIKPPAPTPAKRETAKSAEAAPAAEKIAPKADAAAKSEPAPQAKSGKSSDAGAEGGACKRNQHRANDHQQAARRDRAAVPGCLPRHRMTQALPQLQRRRAIGLPLPRRLKLARPRALPRQRLRNRPRRSPANLTSTRPPPMARARSPRAACGSNRRVNDRPSFLRRGH